MSLEQLLKFLLCNRGTDTEADRMFVLHCHRPRFLMEFVLGGEGDLTSIDDASPDKLPALKAVARIF